MELTPEAASTRGADYVVGRESSALPRPVVEDVNHKVSDLLSEFTDDALRDSYLGTTMEVILGGLRGAQMFPRSTRLNTDRLIAWHRRARAKLETDAALDVICEGEHARLRPYTVLPVQAFGSPLRDVIAEMYRRLKLDQHGFALIWIGSGGYVTPLHHDGELVHGRWHLVVRGAKQFDFMPPRSRRVPRLPPWDLYRRFSPLYTSPIPDTWLTDGTGAHRAHLKPGQMVTWGRRWWHRVQIAEQGVTIALSTRGQVPDERPSPRAIAQQVAANLFGEAEAFLMEQDDDPTIVTPDELGRRVDGRL